MNGWKSRKNLHQPKARVTKGVGVEHPQGGINQP